MKAIALVWVGLVAAMGVSGCSVTASMPAYQARTTEELTGAIEVLPFEYPLGVSLPRNALNNTAAGTITLTEPISDHVANAVRLELRQAGMKVSKSASCKLTGVISDLTLDDLGYSVTYKSTIDFGLHSGDVIWLSKTTAHDIKGDKLNVDVTTALANVNLLVAQSVNDLLTDDAFRAAVGSYCQ